MGYLGSTNQGSQGRRKRLWLAGVVVLLGVLALRPLYGQTPSAQQPSPPALPPAMPYSATERVLELSLEDAIRLALQSNLDIERERFGPPIARTEVEKARAGFDPIAGLTTNLSQTKSLPTTRTGQQEDPLLPGVTRIEPFVPFVKRGEVTPDLRQKVITGANYELRFLNTRENVGPSGSTRRIIDPRFESRLELTFTQPLLRDFGIAVNTAVIRQAQNTEQIAVQQVLQTILDTILNVQQSYWGLVFSIQDLAVKRESQKLAEDFLAENTMRVELGTLAPVELVQAQTRVKTREGEVITAEAAVREAEDGLKEVLNLPETLGTWDLRVRPSETPSFVPIASIPVQEKVDLALKSRPDYMQSQLGIASREIARDFARNQRLPRLDLVGRSSLSAFGDGFDETIPETTEAEGYQWAIGLRFEYPLGNRLGRHELRKRDLELKQAQVDQRLLLRTIVRQIRQAIRDIETVSKRVEVTRAATVLARTQLEAEQEKFRLGLSTSFVVLDFQEDLSIAQSDETRALSDYNVALARLDQVTGKMQYADVATLNK
jgi:outer membrane protein TolC